MCNKAIGFRMRLNCCNLAKMEISTRLNRNLERCLTFRDKDLFTESYCENIYRVFERFDDATVLALTQWLGAEPTNYRALVALVTMYKDDAWATRGHTSYDYRDAITEKYKSKNADEILTDEIQHIVRRVLNILTSELETDANVAA